MGIEILEVKSKSDIKNFVKFPFKVYKDCPQWVPPLISADIKNFNPKINPAFEFCETKLFLAKNENGICGRVAAIINKRYNESKNKNIMRFGWIDFFDDIKISTALINAVETWAIEKKMDCIEGPMGFSDLDPEGMLVEGFNELCTISGIYNHPYYSEHMIKLGYEKEIDWVEYEMVPPNPPNEKVTKISQIILERYNLRFYRPKTKKEIIPYASEIFDVLNDAFKDLHGFISLTEKQKEFYKDMYFGFIEPEYVPLIIDENNRVAGFGITMPSMSLAMQKAKGRLFPFGFIHLLKAMKNPDVLDLYLVGVRSDMRDKGLIAVMMTEVNNVCIKKGIKKVESNYELEDNTRVQNQWKYYTRRQHKRRRCFIKYL